MLLLTFVVRHIIRHRGINLAVLMGLSLGAGLLSSLPTFAAATAGKSLEKSIANSLSSERNIQVKALPKFLSAGLNGFITDEIGGIINERISVSNQRLLAHSKSPMISAVVDKQVKIERIWVWSIDKLSRHSTLLAGEWPKYTPPRNQLEALKPPIIQAAISEEVANDLKISIGDQLQDNNEFKYIISSIIRITDPEEDIWWDEEYPFRVTLEPGLNQDISIVPIIVNPRSMKDFFPSSSSEWRYVINPNKINIQNINLLESKLTRIKHQISSNHAQINTGLLTLIEEHHQNLSIARMVLFLLGSQSFLIVIFTLILMASMLVDSSKSELQTMKGRGASSLQITFAYAIQVLVLALIAGVFLGPLISRLGLISWSWLSGENIPEQMPPESWQMSFLAVGIGWFAILAAVFPVTKINLIDWQQSISRPGGSSSWQTSNIDIFLLIVGGILYWQLSNSGSFIMRRIQGSSIADPLLLLAPSLLLIATAMVSLRLLPFVLTRLGNLAKSNSGAILSIGLNRIARKPQMLNWVILLVSLTAALILFARIYSDALNENQQQIAVYQAGSNLRLDLTKASLEQITDVVDDSAISLVSRGPAQDQRGRGITVLAVDPESFADVSKYPQGLTNLTMKNIMNALSASSGNPLNDEPNLEEDQSPFVQSSLEPIPAIFSYSLIPKDGKIGDQKEFTIAGETIPFIVQGMIADFPTLFTDFIIANQKTLENTTGISLAEHFPIQEGWVVTSQKTHKQLVSMISNSDAILADSQNNLEIIRSNIVTIGTVRAFALNAFIIAAISLAGLVLANYFSYRRRAHEFGILNAIGFSRVQTTRLLIGEGVIVLGLGLTCGFILGIGLARTMRPYISLAVSRTMPGITVHYISLDWFNVAVTIILLIILYGLVTLGLIYYLQASDVQQTLRMGDE